MSPILPPLLSLNQDLTGLTITKLFPNIIQHPKFGPFAQRVRTAAEEAKARASAHAEPVENKFLRLEKVSMMVAVQSPPPPRPTHRDG